MVQEIALGRIIAGALAIVDAIMACFVTSDFSGALLNCDDNVACGLSGAYTATLTGCGEYVVSQLTATVVSVVGLVNNLIPALAID